MKKAFLLFLFITGSLYLSNAQEIFEETRKDFNYNLKGYRILIITYENCSYEETIIMSNKWKEWGANIEIAANSHFFNSTKTRMVNNVLQDDGYIKLQADLLIGKINPLKYDAIYIVGGDNYKLLINNYEDHLSSILNQAYNSNIIISAFCHSPAVLSICDFIKDKQIVVEGRLERELLIKAGAVVKSDVVMSDKNIITGRFPFSETFINTVAEKLVYPNNDGPFRKMIMNKNKFLSLIENTANTQIFSQKKISEDTLDLIIRAGSKAVISEFYSYNKNLKLICIKDSSIIKDFKEILIKENTSNFKNRPNPEEASKNYFNFMLNQASAIILSCNNYPETDPITDPENYLQNKFKYISYNGAVCQNILIAAKSLGVGAKLISANWFLPIESYLKEHLDIPNNYSIVNVIALGYSEFDFVPVVTRPLDEFVLFR